MYERYKHSVDKDWFNASLIRRHDEYKPLMSHSADGSDCGREAGVEGLGNQFTQVALDALQDRTDTAARGRPTTVVEFDVCCATSCSRFTEFEPHRTVRSVTTPDLHRTHDIPLALNKMDSITNPAPPNSYTLPRSQNFQPREDLHTGYRKSTGRGHVNFIPGRPDRSSKRGHDQTSPRRRIKGAPSCPDSLGPDPSKTTPSMPNSARSQLHNILDRTNCTNKVNNMGFYNIQETIGKGNFSQVKLATHLLTKGECI